MLGYQFTLIGHPLGHSMSPWIHERLFKLADKTASYTLTDIAPEDLNASVDELRKLRGFNVTIPYKTDILPHLKELDEWAARYQSVNTVAVNSDGELFGYNTDCAGFLHSVGEIPAGSKALLIGCGGVGRMMATECFLHGADLTIVERDLPRAQELAEELERRFANGEFSMPEGCRKGAVRVLGEAPDEDFDLLMNATPVGMYPKVNACPVSDAVIARSGRVFDVIYNPTETQLIRKARALGKEAVGGSAMLVWQAAVAESIWFNTRFKPEDIWALVEEMNAEVNRLFPAEEAQA
ncbi:MAG: shikimate dehydrogenase [Oscillospiraceae bacterium]|nr:shikimate dehydrogenase [Oscillospiraceae bacterium]